MRGKAIAVEGIDGSGKNTQAEILESFLRKAGLPVKKLSFPMYEGSFFGKEVGAYLNGKFGAMDVVHPKLAAMLYAGDRYESKKKILDLLGQGYYVIFDRYVASNVAHQAAKFPKEQQDEFVEWVNELEYRVYGLPPADLTLFLDVPPCISDGLVSKKGERGYTDKVRDLHEADLEYLGLVYDVFLELSSSKSWKRISCVEGGKVRDIESISNDIVRVVGEALGVAVC